jgi:hypothetical protein
MVFFTNGPLLAISVDFTSNGKLPYSCEAQLKSLMKNDNDGNFPIA